MSGILFLWLLLAVPSLGYIGLTFLFVRWLDRRAAR